MAQAQIRETIRGNLLIITANNEARRELAEIYRDKRHGGYLGAEHFLAEAGYNGANGGLQFLPPERIPEAMTEMPLLAEWTLEDNDETSVWGIVYGFPDYCVLDPWEQLKNKGRVEFVAVADYGPEGARLPAPGSDEAGNINAESFRNCLDPQAPARQYPPAGQTEAEIAAEAAHWWPGLTAIVSGKDAPHG